VPKKDGVKSLMKNELLSWTVYSLLFDRFPSWAAVEFQKRCQPKKKKQKKKTNSCVAAE
jgi:hypothetical protein